MKNIVIFTQGDVFFLPDAIEDLVTCLRSQNYQVHLAITSVSPFGKKSSIRKKIVDTVKIFGIRFFLYYTVIYFRNKVNSHTVAKLALKYDIDTHFVQNVNDERTKQYLAHLEPDLLISFACNQIFGRSFLERWGGSLINVHTALLPKYRGLMPSFWVLAKGEKETGVSVFMVDEGIDSGPIIVQNKFQIIDRNQYHLISETKKLAVKSILQAINLLQKGEVAYLQNDDQNATYYGFPTRADVKEFLNNGNRFF